MEDEEQAKLRKFLEWGTDLGISDSPSGYQTQPPPIPNSCLGHSLTLSYFPNAGGRGLAAARDLRKGELVLRVPKCALMSSQTLMEDQKLSLAVKNHSNLSSIQILAVALLNELDYAIWTAEKAVETAKMERENATELMKELKLKPQLMSFKISSRTMHVPWDTAGCFCPVGDFFNYAAPGEEQSLCEDLKTDGTAVEPDTQHLDASLMRLTDGVYEGDVGAYCLYARKEYRKGDQVLLSYGTYTNLELLDRYGFLLDVLSTMRLWATPLNQCKSIGHLVYSGSNIFTTNEITVLEWISKKCLILKNLSTSIEEDKLLLCTIEKMFDTRAPPMELDDMQPTVRNEISDILECNGLVNGSKVYLLSRKALKSMDRWKLAVKWRLKYKTILDDCILYCTRVINKLSSLDD